MPNPAPPKGHAVQRLVAIMDRLRSPGGCPWDAEQTPESLKPYLVEETYEVLEALDEGVPAPICEELGDLLLQVVFQARLFEEQHAFDIDDVARGIVDKMERRHPHVFADSVAASMPELHRQWDRIKVQEKGDTKTGSTLGGIPNALPSLLRARKLIEKTSRAGVDLPDHPQTIAHISSGLEGLKLTATHNDSSNAEALLGECLFNLANLGRLMGIDAEEALRKTNVRFTDRVRALERATDNPRRDLGSTTPEEAKDLWSGKGSEKNLAPSKS